MSSADYARVLNEANANMDRSPVYLDDDIQKFANGTDPNRYPNTNWLDFVFQNSITTRHSIAASGGNEVVKYHLSAGVDHQTGVIPEITQNVFNVRSNVDVVLNKRLDVSFDIRYTQRKKMRLSDLTISLKMFIKCILSMLLTTRMVVMVITPNW